MNRRDVLKWFGAGAVVLPAAASDVTARLIKPAQVEIIDVPTIVEPFDLAGSYQAQLVLTDHKGRSISIDGGMIPHTPALRAAPRYIAEGDEISIALAISTLEQFSPAVPSPPARYQMWGTVRRGGRGRS